VKENIRTGEIQVGDAEVKVYTRQEQEEHKIGEFGRMTLVEGKYVFFAAPAEMSYPSTQKFSYTFMDKGRQLKSAGSIQTEFKPIVQQPIEFTGASERISDTKKILDYVVDGNLVLHNPSRSTIVAGLNRFPRYIVETQEREAAEEYAKRYKKGKEEPTVIQKYEKTDPIFLGTSLPSEHHKKWFALVPNPHYKREQTEKVSFDETSSVVKITIRRKGKAHEWIFDEGQLRGYGNVYIYPPHVLRQLGMTMANILVSNFPINIRCTREQLLHSSARFIPGDKLWKKEEQGKQVYVDLYGRVHDVKEKIGGKFQSIGTYYSRRARFPELRWVEYAKYGRPVSFFTVKLPFSSIKPIAGTNSVYYGAEILVDVKGEGQDMDLVALTYDWKRTEVGVKARKSQSGALYIYPGVPENSIVFLNEFQAEMGKWVVVGHRPYDLIETISPSHIKYHALQTKQIVDDFAATNIEIEQGIKPSEIAARGLTEVMMRVAGYIKYKEEWYDPYRTQGEIRTERECEDAQVEDCGGMSYAAFFSMSIRNKKDKFLGMQLEKVRELLMLRGYSSRVRRPGVLKVFVKDE